MVPGHVSCTSGDFVQAYPESFDNFSINHSCPGDKIGGESHEALVLMTMNMKKTDSLEKFHGFRNLQEVTFLNSFQKVFPEAAIDVIVVTDFFGFVAFSESLSERIVHVHVSNYFALVKKIQENQISYLSPF